MLFDSTVRKELRRSFGATLVVILTIVLTMMLIRTLGLAAKGNVSPQDVALVLGYVALQHLPTMMALSLFIAIVITLGRMYRDSEMAIWFSSGLGLRRFVRPVLTTAAPVLVVIGALLLIVWPWSNRQVTELRTQYEQRSDLFRISPGTFQASRDGSRVFFVERAGDPGEIGRNLFVRQQTDRGDAVTTASVGRVLIENGDRIVQLDKGHRNETDAETGEHSRITFDELRMLANDDARAARDAVPPKALDTMDLLADPTPGNLGELTYRLGLMFAAANMTLIGIGTSATNPRRASNWNLLFALLAFVVYYNMISLSQAWVSAGKFSPWAALAVVHGGAFAIGYWLLWWREHGAVTRHRLSLRRAPA